MGFSVGIVGLPNVGKSTLFKTLTQKEIEISNYPFCTIDPNVGIVKVPDNRLEKLANFSQSTKIIPTAIEFVDIAGLVKGAHQGEGLGNKFLANIREVDMILHIVRGFENENITHVNNKVNPENDIFTINTELILTDLDTVEKKLLKTEKEVRVGNKIAIQTQNVLNKYKTALEQEQMASTVQLDEIEKPLVKELQLLTNKPVLYVVNINEKQDINQESFLPNIYNKIFLPIQFELDLSELTPEEATLFRADTNQLNTHHSMEDLVIQCYKLLNLVTFFTTGKEETRAWTIPENSSAPRAGRAIHSDFENKFIRANIINWHTLISNKTWGQASENGLVRIEGKNYIVQDGDVIEFKI